MKVIETPVDPSTAATTTTTAVDNTEEKKKPLKINFSDLFGEDHDEPAKELTIVHTKKKRRPPEKERESAVDDDGDSSSRGDGGGGEDFSATSDIELKERIDRQRNIMKSIAVLSKLPDKGDKIKANLKRMEDELQRRQLRRSNEVANGFKKPAHLESSSTNGFYEGSKQAASSQFALSFMKKLEDDNPKLEQNTSNQASNAFDREISCLNPCDKSKRKSAGKLPHSKRAKPDLYSKRFNVWNPDCITRYGRKHMLLNGKQAGRVSSFGSLPFKEKTTVTNTDEEGSQGLDTNGLMNEETVVLVDEEGPELIEKKQEAEDLPSMPNEGKIYYPSRKDPESLEIFRSELKCLEPGECLTSTIMNFYIRYLQEQCSSADSSQHNFYFFNTYFYSKLQEAVAYQKSDKEAFFMKFRRWWKGVNIFQKAYIFLPINEDNHWSLAIICIPDEVDESRLVMLHLDSLGLHSSGSIFDNVKSLLINEWRILNKDDDADAPIPDRIWQTLPRRIEQKYVVVPRQTNDYDCGLFVLYYMKRFIEDAPERLTRQLLTMFGKHWFKPRDASRLRGNIKSILQKEFEKALEQDNWTWEPVCLSVNAETSKAIDHAEIS